MHHPRRQKFNIENPISMGSDEERCIFIDVQCSVHVYQISDENISLRFFLQGEDIGSYQDVLKSNHWSTLFFK